MLKPVNKINLLAIGASTGGTEALLKALQPLPEQFPIPIVITLHIPEHFDHLFVKRLNETLSLPVHLAETGMVLEAGHVYIAPAGSHMTVMFKQGNIGIQLNDDPPEHSCKPAVDVLFRSVAKLYLKQALGVVLTGMGQDGLEGVKTLRAHGAKIVVQDKTSSVVWGMPGIIAEEGYADAEVPLNKLPELFLRFASFGRAKIGTKVPHAKKSQSASKLRLKPLTKKPELKQPLASLPKTQPVTQATKTIRAKLIKKEAPCKHQLSEEDFDTIKSLVTKKAGINLPDSKSYLIASRLQSLLEREGIDSISTLVERLNAGTIPFQHVLEIVDRLLTHETSFFRDKVPFEVLKKDVLPRLIQQNQKSKQLKIWCAACSYGQEPYSIALLIQEHFPELAEWKIDICGTDLSDPCLEHAKKGVYSSLEVSRGLATDLLKRHFILEQNDWHLRPEIKRMVQFKKLNLIDKWHFAAPFDIIFCRNVLIYFNVECKQKIVTQLEQRLVPNGFLFMGGGESVIGISDQFQKAFIAGSCCYGRVANQ